MALNSCGIEFPRILRVFQFNFGLCKEGDAACEIQKIKKCQEETKQNTHPDYRTSHLEEKKQTILKMRTAEVTAFICPGDDKHILSLLTRLHVHHRVVL